MLEVVSRLAAKLEGGLEVYLRPRLAADAKCDFLPEVRRGVNGRNCQHMKGVIINRVAKAVKGELAQDANIDNLVALLDALCEGMSGDPSPRQPNKTYESSSNPNRSVASRGGGEDESEEEAERIGEKEQERHLSRDAAREICRGSGMDDNQTEEIPEMLFGGGGLTPEEEGLDSEEGEVKQITGERAGTGSYGSIHEARKDATDRKRFSARDKRRMGRDNPQFSGAPNSGGTMQPLQPQKTMAGSRSANDIAMDKKMAEDAKAFRSRYPNAPGVAVSCGGRSDQIREDRRRGFHTTHLN